jgi:hypothetical protein
MWYGLRNVLWFPLTKKLRKQSLMKLICTNSPFTPEQDVSRFEGEFYIAKYVSEWDTCHKMKASHLKSAGVLQPLSIPMWKWDDISLDFIVGLPLAARNKDSIWVSVDKLTKTAHLIAVYTTYSVQQYAELYMDQIVRLHVIPKTIISDRGTQFFISVLGAIT